MLSNSNEFLTGNERCASYYLTVPKNRNATIGFGNVLVPGGRVREG